MVQPVRARPVPAASMPPQTDLGRPAAYYPRGRRAVVFGLWLLTFYTVWALLVFAGGRWAAVKAHWGIALAMAAGSYIAGSTPMGGGTVGFPILVLLFKQPVEVGRVFSFAVQSVGMVSASFFILLSGQPVAGRVLRWAIATAAFTVPLYTLVVVPQLAPLAVKLLFSVVWASFGLMHLVKVSEFVAFSGLARHPARVDRLAGAAIGLFGGLVAAVTGNGIDMVLYCLLVALFRADLKIAIPTSVIAMGATSVIGSLTHLALGGFSAEVVGNWLAAAPVVILGAPIGALVVSFLPRRPTLLIVAGLCLVQLGWTAYVEKLGPGLLGLALLGVLLFNLVFHLLYRAGRRWFPPWRHLPSTE